MSVCFEQICQGPVLGTFSTESAKSGRNRVPPSTKSYATTIGSRPRLQNPACDQVNVNLVMTCCVLKQNFPYHAPAHFFQSSVERNTIVRFLRYFHGLTQRDCGMRQCC